MASYFMNKYKITKIMEDDYGCEDRPDNVLEKVND